MTTKPAALDKVKSKFDNSLELIGSTPLVKLNKVTAGVQGTILAKMEYFNPGNSMKDRIAVKMIEDAEKRGEPGTNSTSASSMTIGAPVVFRSSILAPCRNGIGQ